MDHRPLSIRGDGYAGLGQTSRVRFEGGGPVGLVPAMDLARHGITTVVLEQRKEIPPNPCCNTTNARSMELLWRLGCADAVSSARYSRTSSAMYSKKLTTNSALPSGYRFHVRSMYLCG